MSNKENDVFNQKENNSRKEVAYGSILPDGRLVVKGYDDPNAEFVDTHDTGRYV